MSFFSRLFSWKPKRIAFLDGDQPLPQILDAYHEHLKGVETHLVRVMADGHNEPKILRHENDFNKIYLYGYTTGKEVTDKFIGANIQKAISDGYTEITVVSSDYDFIDIFKLAVTLNPKLKTINFKLIVPPNPAMVSPKMGKDSTCTNIQVMRL